MRNHPEKSSAAQGLDGGPSEGEPASPHECSLALNAWKGQPVPRRCLSFEI